jgi:hypothetical protein
MIWITQWLCPSRHCSIAIPWDDQTKTSKEVEEKGEDLYQRGVLKRRCGRSSARSLYGNQPIPDRYRYGVCYI